MTGRTNGINGSPPSHPRDPHRQNIADTTPARTTAGDNHPGTQAQPQPRQPHAHCPHPAPHPTTATATATRPGTVAPTGAGPPHRASAWHCPTHPRRHGAPMIALLLAAAPHTPAETLAHLARTPNLSADVRHALRTHPNLPDAVLTHLVPDTRLELHAALTAPTTTPRRRAALLAAAHSPQPSAPLWQHITYYTELTPTEIRDAVSAHPATLTTCAMALALNPNTPTDIATPALNHLTRHQGHTSRPRSQMAIIAAAERHHHNPHHTAAALTATRPRDANLAAHLTAYLTAHDTHGTTYAQHLTDTLPPAQWADALKATSDPQLATHALNDPLNADAVISIQNNARLPHHHLPAILTRLTTSTSRFTLEAIATLTRHTPPTTTQAVVVHATHTTPRRQADSLHQLFRHAAANPTTTADTLTHIANSLQPRYARALDYATIAAHPNATPELRSHCLANAQPAVDPAHHTLIALAQAAAHHHVTHHIPLPELGTHPAIRHHLLSTAHTHAHWPRGHTHALALLTLAPNFTGTLDQLLTAAHAVAH